MALRDWNHNGNRNDMFDNMMDFQLYRMIADKRDPRAGQPEGGNGGGCGCLIALIMVVFFLILFFFL